MSERDLLSPGADERRRTPNGGGGGGWPDEAQPLVLISPDVVCETHFGKLPLKNLHVTINRHQRTQGGVAWLYLNCINHLGGGKASGSLGIFVSARSSVDSLS